MLSSTVIIFRNRFLYVLAQKIISVPENTYSLNQWSFTDNLLCFTSVSLNEAFQKYANLKSFIVCVWLGGFSLTCLHKFTEVFYIPYLQNAETNEA